jgi:hypothetical protein
MTPALVSLIVVLLVAGATALVLLSGRLRREVADLLHAFDRVDRRVVPLVATVRSDRDRLAARLARLADSGDDTTRR